MKQIGNQQNGPRIPWWLYRIIKFLINLNSAFEKLIRLLFGVVSTTFKVIVRIGLLVILAVIIFKLGQHLTASDIPSVQVPPYAVLLSILISSIGLWRLIVWKTKKDAEDQDINTSASKDDESEPTGNTKTPLEKKMEKAETFFETWWVKGRLLPMLVCFILIHYAIYQLFPGFWWNNIWTQKSFGLQLAIGAAISVKPQNEKKPGKYKLSTFATFMLLLTLMVSITIGNVEAGITKATTWFETNLNKEKALRTAPITSSGEIKYPRDEHWSDKDVAEKILEGQWDLLAACYRESGLKQFGPDGKPLVNQNKNGLGTVTSVDTGICQINSVHDPELTRLGLDKNKLEDNLRFAKILYEKEGLKPWNIQPGQKLTFQVPISDKGTNTFKRPQNVYTLFNNKESVHIALNNERWVTVLEADPGFTDFTPAGTIMDYKFTLLAGKTDTWVTVTYTYQ